MEGCPLVSPSYPKGTLTILANNASCERQDNMQQQAQGKPGWLSPHVAACGAAELELMHHEGGLVCTLPGFWCCWRLYPTELEWSKAEICRKYPVWGTARALTGCG